MVFSSILASLRRPVRKARSWFKLAILAYPKRVQCNLCGWTGRHFFSDDWHAHIQCPGCGSDVRQRLFFAALKGCDDLSFQRLIEGRKILHFAPEAIVSSSLGNKASTYITTDFLREDCDLMLDMSSMEGVDAGSVDVVIAFDVLEHVPNYPKALGEVQRILSAGGYAIFTVPQKDGLAEMQEDPAINTPEARLLHYGQWDHLRIFGDDFAARVEAAGFQVTTVDEGTFPRQQVRRNVLSPPRLSAHPLATNHRKVFFCRKLPQGGA